MLGFSSRANWRNCCTARCWSIWYRLFIATLSFSWQKKPPSAHYDRGCESRYFLRINGHPPVKAISDPLQKVSPLTTGEEFLTMVENSSGLLLEREIGVYSFAHLTVQEYLAALHIQAHQLENDLIQQLGNTARAFFARLL